MTLPTVDLTGSLVENLHEVLRATAEKGPLATDEMTGATVVLRHRDLETLARDQRLNGIGLALFDMMGITNGPLRDWYSRLMFTTEGDYHRRMRSLVSRAFTPRSAEAWHDGRNGLHRCRFGPGRRRSCSGVWRDPDKFDPDRFTRPDTPRLLNFGAGTHFCLGTSLAKLVVESCVRSVLADVPPLRLVEDPADLPWRRVLGRSPARLVVNS